MNATPRPRRRLAASLLAAGALALLLAPTASARYLRPDLDNVPVERLIKNLQKRVADKPEDVKARQNLARAHGMAYAQKSDTIQVRKGKDEEGAWFGFEPANVPFAAFLKKTDDADKLKAAKEHLQKAIKLYEQVGMVEPTNLTARLGHAWLVDQSGEKEKAVKEYRKVIEDAWAKEKDLKQGPLGWHSITSEAA